MNKRIGKLVEQAEEWVCKNYPDAMDDNDEFHAQTMEKLAELIVAECTAVLFDESERLSGLSLNEDNWNYALEYEVCSNQCINDIALIEKHFGVEE